MTKLSVGMADEGHRVRMLLLIDSDPSYTTNIVKFRLKKEQTLFVNEPISFLPAENACVLKVFKCFPPQRLWDQRDSVELGRELIFRRGSS